MKLTSFARKAMPPIAALAGVFFLLNVAAPAHASTAIEYQTWQFDILGDPTLNSPELVGEMTGYPVLGYPNEYNITDVTGSATSDNCDATGCGPLTLVANPNPPNVSTYTPPDVSTVFSYDDVLYYPGPPYLDQYGVLLQTIYNGVLYTYNPTDPPDTAYLTIANSGTGSVITGSATVDVIAVTPLPAALPLFATALGGLGLLGWRRKRKAQAAAG